MKGKSNHTTRVTFRVTAEEYAALEYIARRDGFGTVSAVIRTILESRLQVIRDIISERVSPCQVGDEIREMFSNYESDGERMQYPSDINGRK